MFWLLLLVTTLARAETCYNEHAQLVTSLPGVTCTECYLEGYLSGGRCVCYVSNANAYCQVQALAPQTVNSTCGAALCRDDDGDCVLSAPGARCQECGLAGYINGTTCACYERYADPGAACALVINPAGVANFNTTAVDSHCAWFQNAALGFYHSNDRCGTLARAMDFVGPPPNQALTEECLTYGGPDPEQPLAGFFTCNNHGVWNATAFNCTCDPGWAFENTGETGLFNETVLSCTRCAPWYGPVAGAPPFCTVPYTPDPVDGILKGCSGHGFVIDGECFCYANATGGYWALVDFLGVETCAGCAPGFLLPNCTLTSAPSASPTASPSTSAPVSDSPTVAPAPSTQTPTPFNITGLSYLYYGPSLELALMGDQSAGDARCAVAAPTCPDARVLACTSTGVGLLDYPNAYAFNESLPLFVQGTTYENVAAEAVIPFWAEFVFVNFFLQNVNLGCDFFTGNATADNCDDFTNPVASFEMTIINNSMLANYSLPCTAIVPTPCVCLL